MRRRNRLEFLGNERKKKPQKENNIKKNDHKRWKETIIITVIITRINIKRISSRLAAIDCQTTTERKSPTKKKNKNEIEIKENDDRIWFDISSTRKNTNKTTGHDPAAQRHYTPKYSASQFNLEKKMWSVTNKQWAILAIPTLEISPIINPLD